MKSLIPFAKSMLLNPYEHFFYLANIIKFHFINPLVEKLNVLDLVFFNVCGPIELYSGGYRYFVDDA